ncbi:hypothetical protein [Candidatus Endomicrobiellum agilis]|uniref:hypothetical protein n=1 Tax=Candidatus Endomicrobiellum agilis TaxID=3238957 RepID=UPI0035829BB9|nr:hypothetical protein [Endomicrobium sp.]
MKKIICICICICIFLTSGCDKLPDHGRPADIVVKDKGSEAPHSLTSNTPNASAPAPSNTPAPTPEPSKSVQPSDTTDTGSSVGKYVGWAFAFIALIVGCYDVFRYFKPKEIIVPAPNPVGYVTWSVFESNYSAYGYCYHYSEDIISYTWYLAKKVARRCFWTKAGLHNERIDSEITVYELRDGNRRLSSFVYQLET